MANKKPLQKHRREELEKAFNNAAFKHPLEFAAYRAVCAMLYAYIDEELKK